MLSGRPILRSLVLLLAISATLLVSTAAASPAHLHKANFDGSCDICTVAHLPVIQPALSVQLFAPGISKVRVTILAIARPSKPFVHVESSRGPPTLPFALFV